MGNSGKPRRGERHGSSSLLDHYGCPTPFHAVRTRFLGNIASPLLGASPLDQVNALWGANCPSFPDLDAANELVGALVMGLWNRLRPIRTASIRSA